MSFGQLGCWSHSSSTKGIPSRSYFSKALDSTSGLASADTRSTCSKLAYFEQRSDADQSLAVTRGSANRALEELRPILEGEEEGPGIGCSAGGGRTVASGRGGCGAVSAGALCASETVRRGIASVVRGIGTEEGEGFALPRGVAAAAPFSMSCWRMLSIASWRGQSAVVWGA